MSGSTLLGAAWDPTSLSISAPYNAPFTQTFTYSKENTDGDQLQVNIGLYSAAGGSPLSNSTPVFTGVTTQADSPSTTCAITISGTPTVNGAYPIYVRGTYNNGAGDVHEWRTYTVNVTDGPALTTSPASGTVGPALAGQGYVSPQFTISNGSGNYTITLVGAPTSIGLSSTAVEGSGVPSTLTIASNAFYLANKSGSYPTTGSYPISITVHDNNTNLPNWVPTFTFEVTNSGGTLSVTQTSGDPTCTQEYFFNRHYKVTGGTAPYAWSVIGALPTGLLGTVSDDTAILSGVPTGDVISSGGDNYPFTIQVTDNASHTGTLLVNLTVLPGASYTGGPLPTTGVIGTAITATTLTAIGGDGTAGAYRWRISYKVGAATYAGLPAGLVIAQGGTPSGNYLLVSGLYATFQGTPNTAGNYTILATPYSPVGASLFPGTQASFPLSITGVSDLPIGPADLGNGWVQNVSLSKDITVGSGTGPYAWVVSGLPPGLTGGAGTAATTTITGGTTSHGTYSVTVSVTDSSGTPKHGIKSYSLVVAPSIWVDSGLAAGPSPPAGNLPSGVKGSSYTNDVVFKGGDNTGFNYTVGGLSGTGITAVPQGTGNKTLHFHADVITAVAGTYNVTVTATATGCSTPQYFNFPIIITGGGTVTLVPFATTLRARDALISIVPKVRIGAIVTGGTYNTYTVGAPAGWTIQNVPGGGAFSSNQPAICAQDTDTDGVYTFVLTSVEEGGVHSNVTVTVDSLTAAPPTISPSTGENGGLAYNMYKGDSVPFVASFPNSGCNSYGVWQFPGGGVPSGVTFNPSSQRGGAVTVNVTQTIDTPVTLVLNYGPDEDPERVTNIYINLIPGVKPPFYISTASLPDGDAGPPGVAYSQALATSGGTNPALYPPGSVTFQYLPAGLVLNSSGVISGTPTISGISVFTVTTKDSRTPTPYWTSKTFALTVTSGGGTPTITSLTPNFGPIGGGTSIGVHGTNFMAGDTLNFRDPSHAGVYAVGTTTGQTSTLLTVTSPVWTHGAMTVDVAVVRGGIEVTYKTGAFTYGGADFSVGTFSPAFATVGDPDKIIHVFGSNFDSSCSIKFTRSDGGGEQTLSSQVFNSSTDISGTITATNFTTGHTGQTGQIKVTKTDGSYGTSSTVFSINGTNLTVTTTTLANATRTTSYSQALAASGGSGTGYTWAIAPGTGIQPPTGITLHADGTLTATTVDAGATSTTPTFEVTDSLGNKKDKAIQILAIGGDLSITTTSPLPNANIGSLYGKYVVASGGVLPYIFTKTSGALPLGINLGTDGNLTGIPTTGNSAPSDFSFSVLVTDSTPITPLTKTAAFALHLDPAISTVTVTGLNPGAGPITGGIPVTITGTGFLNGCTVQFGAISATSVQFVSGTSIIATTPPAASGAVSVSVRNPDGGNGAYAGIFFYQVLSFPLITNIDKQDGPFAGGQTITLSGSNFQGISAVQFISANNVTIAASFDPANINLASFPQTAIITTPPGFTFGDGSVAVAATISVTNASGTGTWPLGDNGYMYRPPPIITAVVPNTGPTSGGQTVYVIGKNFFQRGAVKPRVFIGNVEVPASSITLKEQ